MVSIFTRRHVDHVHVRRKLEENQELGRWQYNVPFSALIDDNFRCIQTRCLCPLQQDFLWRAMLRPLQSSKELRIIYLQCGEMEVLRIYVTTARNASVL